MCVTKVEFGWIWCIFASSQTWSAESMGNGGRVVNREVDGGAGTSVGRERDGREESNPEAADPPSGCRGGANGLLSPRPMMLGRLRRWRFRWQTMHNVATKANPHAPSDTINGNDDSSVNSSGPADWKTDEFPVENINNLNALKTKSKRTREIDITKNCKSVVWFRGKTLM